jgi:hypothetical protein
LDEISYSVGAVVQISQFFFGKAKLDDVFDA